MRRILWFAILCAIPNAAFAAGSVKTGMVKFNSGNEPVAAYLALLDQPAPYPAVIVIHEWWGLNDWIKEQARKLAEQGYLALAVDLYRGKSTSNASEAHELMRGMPQHRAIRDLEAAFEYLVSRSDVRKDKIGTVGWCMGGGLSLQLAVHEPRLAACVVYYGAMPTDSADIGKIQAPVLGNFGADDRGIPASAVEAFEKAMRTSGKSIDVKVYTGAGHAFANPNNVAGYRAQAATDAWQRTLAFFGRTLK